MLAGVVRIVKIFYAEERMVAELDKRELEGYLKAIYWTMIAAGVVVGLLLAAGVTTVFGWLG